MGLTRELCFTVTILCSQTHSVRFQVQWGQNPVVIRAGRAKGSLTHEPHQRGVGLHTGPLLSDTQQNFSLLGSPVTDSAPHPSKWGPSAIGKEAVLQGEALCLNQHFRGDVLTWQLSRVQQKDFGGALTSVARWVWRCPAK